MDGPSCYVAGRRSASLLHRLNLSYYDVSKMTMIGPSGALKFSDNISLGFTLYAIYYTRAGKDRLRGLGRELRRRPSGGSSRFHENNVTRTVNQTGLGATGSFGILVRMDQGFSFGANISPGSLVWIDRTEEQRVEDIRNDSRGAARPNREHPFRGQISSIPRPGRKSIRKPPRPACPWRFRGSLEAVDPRGADGLLHGQHLFLYGFSPNDTIAK